MKLAGSILSESALPRREVILITDFQRSGWQGGEGVRLPDGAVLTPVAITDSGKANLAIAPVSLQQSEFQNQQRITVTTGAVNHTDVAVSNVEIALEIDGRAIQSRRVNVAARGSASATFDPVTVADRNVRATVRLAADALASDNVFNFVVSPENPVDVIIARTLRVGAQYEPVSDACRRGQRSAAHRGQGPPGRFAVERGSAAASVVILNDAPIAQTTAERLQAFVQRGGGLLRRRRRAGDAGRRWPTSCPACRARPSIARAARRRASARSSTAIRCSRCFAGRAPGDFASARFYGYRGVTPGPNSSTLARFDDGQPALLERRVGTGRVLMWTSTLDTTWTDLALKPVFVPFVHRVVRYLGAYREPRPWRTVGDVVDPGLQAPAKGSDVSRVALTPSGARISLDGDGPEVLELAEQGFYEFRAQGRDADTPVVVASNVDLAESDLTAARSAGDRGGRARAGGRRGGRAAGAADRRCAGVGPARLVVFAVCRAAAARRRNCRGQPVDGVSWFSGIRELNAYEDY